jgi:hypothetical protein
MLNGLSGTSGNGLASDQNECYSEPEDGKLTCVKPSTSWAPSFEINKRSTERWRGKCLSETEVNYGSDSEIGLSLTEAFCNSPYPILRFHLCCLQPVSGHWG